MIGQYIADDYYFCLSKSDLLALAQTKNIQGFFIESEKIYNLILKIDLNGLKSSEIFSDKALETFTFRLARVEAQEFLENGRFLNRIASSNVYIFSEIHNREEYEKYRNMLNASAYAVERNWKGL